MEARSAGAQTGGQTQLLEAVGGIPGEAPPGVANRSLPASSRLGRPPSPGPAGLTALEDGAVVRQAAAALERRAVPALVAQLVLTLVDRDVQALQRGRGHVGAAQAQPQLPLAQAGQRQAHGVGGQRRLARQLQAQDLIAQGPGKRDGVAGSGVQASRPRRALPPAGAALPPGREVGGVGLGAHRLQSARTRRPARPQGGGRGRGCSRMSKPRPEGPGGQTDQGLRDRGAQGGLWAGWLARPPTHPPCPTWSSSLTSVTPLALLVSPQTTQ